jgi:hypothetical protein
MSAMAKRCSQLSSARSFSASGKSGLANKNAAIWSFATLASLLATSAKSALGAWRNLAIFSLLATFHVNDYAPIVDCGRPRLHPLEAEIVDHLPDLLLVLGQPEIHQALSSSRAMTILWIWLVPS